MAGTFKAGIPHGFILGLLLFLIYLNDVTDGSICNEKLFTTDTVIFNVVYA